jgi:hypothetical protein
VRLRGLDHGLVIDHLHRDCLARAGLDAGWSLAVRQPVAAQITLSDDAERLVVLRRVVGTHQGAVRAADALIVEVFDDAGDRVLFVGLNRAAEHAGGFEAVMAGAGHRLLGGRLRCAAVQQADRAKYLVFVEAIQ